MPEPELAEPKNLIVERFMRDAGEAGVDALVSLHALSFDPYGSNKTAVMLETVYGSEARLLYEAGARLVKDPEAMAALPLSDDLEQAVEDTLIHQISVRRQLERKEIPVNRRERFGELSLNASILRTISRPLVARTVNVENRNAG